MDIDKIINTSLKDLEIIDNMPVLDFHIFGISFFIEKIPSYNIELIETYPYELDGETPILIINFWYFSVLFANKWLYKLVYRKKYGYNPKGLE